MQDSSKFAHEFVVRHRVGRGRDIYALHGFIGQRAKDQSVQVSNVNPTDVLPAMTGCASQKKAGQSRERLQRSAGATQDEADAQDHLSAGEMLVGKRFLPCPPDVGSQAGAERGGFIENFVRCVAEDVRGAGLDPNLWRIRNLVIRLAQCFHRVYARFKNFPFVSCGRAAINGSANKIDYPVSASEFTRPWANRLVIPMNMANALLVDPIRTAAENDRLIVMTLEISRQ
jgi:hypothetical protein